MLIENKCRFNPAVYSTGHTKQSCTAEQSEISTMATASDPTPVVTTVSEAEIEV